MRERQQELDSLNRLADHDLLTADEERSLIARAQAGDQAAMDEIVRKNCRLLLKMANTYHSVPIEDLFQEGAVGLVKAVKRFDLSREDEPRLATYAIHWIRAMMSACCERQTLHDEDNVSFEELLDLKSDNKLNDLTVSHDPDGLDVVMRREAEQVLLSVLKELPERERKIAYCLYYKDFTLDKTAVALAKSRADGRVVSRERVRQMELKLLKRLRAAVAKKGLDPK